MVLNIDGILDLFSEERSKETRIATILGFLMMATVGRREVSPCTLGWFLRGMRRAADLGQVQLYFDGFGRYCGHVVWTCLPINREREMLQHGPRILVAEDFSMQGELWILDFRALYGEWREILIDMQTLLPDAGKSISYFRYKEGVRLAKRISRCRLDYPGNSSGSRSFCEWGAFLASDDGVAFRQATRQTLDFAREVGFAAQLLSLLPKYADMPLDKVFGHFRNAIQRRQYRLYVSESGCAAGFFTWAWMEARDVRSKRMESPRTVEYGQWNEGRDLFLCDAVATQEGVCDVLEDLRGRWHSSEKLFVFPRGDDDRADNTCAFPVYAGRRMLPDIAGPAEGVLDIAQALLDGDVCLD